MIAQGWGWTLMRSQLDRHGARTIGTGVTTVFRDKAVEQSRHISFNPSHRACNACR